MNTSFTKMTLLLIMTSLGGYLPNAYADGPLWPPLEARTTIPANDEAQLLARWKAAEDSGLLAERRAILRDVTGRVDGYRASCFRFNNPALIDMMEALYRTEYECWKAYLHQQPEAWKTRESAHCEQEIRKGKYDETSMEYRDAVNTIALSTFSPAILDIALSDFCCLPTERTAYLNEVAPEPYVQALLGSEPEQKGQLLVLTFDFHGTHSVEVLEAVQQLITLLKDRSALRSAQAERIREFANGIENAYRPADPDWAGKLTRRQRILERHIAKLRNMLPADT